MNTTNHHVGRFLRLLGAFFIALLAVVASAGASTRWATLEAIRNLENPRNVSRPGPRGELGAYQFRAATWRMHTSIPFHQAVDRETSEQIAVRHYEWIKRGLEVARKPATPYYIALAWNGGLSAAVAGKSPRAAHNYAERAANLAVALHEDQVVASAR